MNQRVDANFLPHLAFDGQGRSVLTWYRFAPDAGQGEIVVRRFKPQGAAAGPRATVNQFSRGEQINPDIAMNASGNFVVTWESRGQGGKVSSIFARVYRWRTPVSAEIPVSKGAPGDFDGHAKVGMDAEGNFVVVWDAVEADGNVFYRRFDKSGRARGPALRVSETVSNKGVPDIAVKPDGSFTIVWRTWDYGAQRAFIHARSFDAAGTPASGEVQVSQEPIRNQGFPAVGLGPDGSLVMAWEHCNFLNFAAGCGLFARRLDASGGFLDDEFQVSPNDSRAHQAADVAFDSRGAFAITWNDCRFDDEGQSYDCQVQTAFYAPDGALLDRHSIDSPNNLLSPTVTGLPEGFIAVWFTINCDALGCEGVGLPQGIFAQRYEVDLPR